MNELIKGPNKRGREDFENAIYDHFGDAKFSKFYRSVPTMVALRGSRVWQANCSNIQ
jgi:hypothetical protein